MQTQAGGDSQYVLDGDITLRIQSAGQEVAFSELLVSVETLSAFGKIPAARLTFQDNASGLEAADSHMLSIGDDVEVWIGRGEATRVFRGRVSNRGLRLGQKEGALLTVTAKHEAVRMTQSPRFRAFREMSDSDVIMRICSEYGLTARVDDTGVVHEKLVQYNATDWDFINMRAEASGLILFPTPEGLSAIRPDVSRPPAVCIGSGLSLSRAELSVNGRDMIPGISAGAWNYTLQQMDQVQVSTGSQDTLQGRQGSAELARRMGNEELAMTLLSGQSSADAMKMMAQGRAMRSDLSRITGSAVIRGFASVFPLDVVQLEGLGKDLDGKAVVGTVVQEFSESDWYTTLGLGLENVPFDERFTDVGQKPSDGAMPAATGLQTAKVEAIEGDPQGEERILVRLLGSGEAALWARIALADAGKDRGLVLMPEIGDEVVLGFLAGNPSEAVVLGMLHSSALPSPLAKSDDNDLKAMVTRSGLRIEMDDASKTVTVLTPGGNRLRLCDEDKGILLEDQNGNRILTDSDGVTIESQKDITLKAKGNVKLEGANLELSASAKMTLKGSGSSELSSSGNTVIKGAIVQIN